MYLKKLRAYRTKLIKWWHLHKFIDKRSMLSLLRTLTSCLLFKAGYDKYESKRIDTIRLYLDHQLRSSFKSLQTKTPVNVEAKEQLSHIWLFWYQGEEAMPEIVKLCLRSIRHHVSDLPVTLLHKNNIREYVTLPESIYRQLDNGVFNIVHFSDILRSALLFQKGGLWIDATILALSQISIPIECQTFYSIKPGNKPFGRTISDYRWTGFCLYAPCGSRYMNMLYHLFLAYWAEHDQLIDYLLIDYMLDFIYRHDASFRNSVDSMPITHPAVHTFSSMLSSPYDQATFEAITNHSSLFKLNYRSHYPLETDGKPTLFAHISTIIKNN